MVGLFVFFLLDCGKVWIDISEDVAVSGVDFLRRKVHIRHGLWIVI